ncbi:coiled-coil domain-containing protein 127-like [Seriola lalandi dorsalis]|uniref:coiled-coil domain-containing protein 127-like n=1 Tax=Seriola lalandi dorsalis TaxID=1841481 RepID=UPI000C6F8539|nr:coiled-coil domain-containing protein 127-like [Seriola lalandi dorsalis]XP_023267672.1 coiled-coil domain-containing protein 127-like [Seriola lalandi dorsalis]
MNNLNTEEDGDDVRGGGGRGWWTFSLATGVAALLWKIYQSKKKEVEELEVTVRIYRDYIKQDQQEKLTEVENLLVERQHVFCSYRKLYSKRQQLEEQILQKASALESLIPDMSKTVKRIFTEDCHCGSSLTYIWTRDKRKNGRLMWEEMKNWRSMLENNGRS